MSDERNVTKIIISNKRTIMEWGELGFGVTFGAITACGVALIIGEIVNFLFN